MLASCRPRGHSVRIEIHANKWLGEATAGISGEGPVILYSPSFNERISPVNKLRWPLEAGIADLIRTTVFLDG